MTSIIELEVKLVIECCLLVECVVTEVTANVCRNEYRTSVLFSARSIRRQPKQAIPVVF